MQWALEQARLAKTVIAHTKELNAESHVRSSQRNMEIMLRVSLWLVLICNLEEWNKSQKLERSGKAATVQSTVSEVLIQKTGKQLTKQTPRVWGDQKIVWSVSSTQA